MEIETGFTFNNDCGYLGVGRAGSMFQIVSTLMEEVPSFALRMRELRGEQPKVQLMDNPWGHVEDCVAKCNCLDTDRTGAYVQCLIPRTGLSDSTPLNDADVSVEIEPGFTFNND